MLTHPTLDQLRALKLDGMVAGLRRARSAGGDPQSGARRMAGAAARPRGRRSRHPALPDPTARRSAASQPSRDRGRRLPHAAPARQGAVPAVGHLPLDRRAPRLAGHRPVRRRQVVVILRARAEGLPRRLHRPLRARAAPVRRSRSRPRRRPLRAAVPDAGQGRSPRARRLGTRPPLGQPAARPHGDRRGSPWPRLHPDHQPTPRGNLA